jgi:hypothetical protein
VLQAAILVNIPTRHFAERYQLHINLHLTVALLNPLAKRFAAVDGVIGCKQGMYHIQLKV